jgi:hypothetical protein
MADKAEFSPQLKPAKLYWFTWSGIKVLFVRSAWRYFITGRELRGEGDNATFLHDATVDHRGRPYEKLTRARWRRLARRWALLGIPWLLLDLSLLSVVAWEILVAYTIGASVIGAGLGVRRFAIWWPQREVRRELQRPAAEVLCRILGAKVPRRRLHTLIELPPGFGEVPEDGAKPEAVRVHMPVNVPLDDKTKERIAREVGARLGLPNASGSWTIATARPYVDLLPAPLPARELSFADVRHLMEDSDITAPFFGMTAGRRPSHLDYKNDSPHVLASAGAGGGKTSMLRVIAMQRMRKGAGAIFLDFKKWSHIRWVRGLPPTVALYFHEVPAMHDALVAVMDEVLRRKNIDDESELDALRPLDIYVEEMNTLVPMLIEYWRVQVAQAKAAARTAMLMAKDSGDPQDMADALEAMAQANGLPLTSPAVQALRWGVNLGREFKVHFYFIGQSMSGNASTGRDTRASFKTRLLARWDRKDWRMLAEGAPFVVCPPGPVGLWAHVHGSEVDIVRVPWVTNKEARDFVLSAPVPRTAILSRDIGGQVDTLTRGGVSTAPDALAPLSAIVPELPPGRGGKVATVETLRVAAKRRTESGFPDPSVRGGQGRADLYCIADIHDWWCEREEVAIAG